MSTEGRLELVGQDARGFMAHLNCPEGKGGGVAADLTREHKEISYCADCLLDIPEEVCASFEVMEDGRETEDKPHLYGGYDPPVWRFDGTEWRTTA